MLRFPRRRNASDFTADELHRSLLWFERSNPKKVERARRRYKKFRRSLLTEIERACREICDPKGAA
jgi:hypothetical protein